MQKQRSLLLPFPLNCVSVNTQQLQNHIYTAGPVHSWWLLPAESWPQVQWWGEIHCRDQILHFWAGQTQLATTVVSSQRVIFIQDNFKVKIQAKKKSQAESTAGVKGKGKIRILWDSGKDKHKALGVKVEALLPDLPGIIYMTLCKSYRVKSWKIRFIKV